MKWWERGVKLETYAAFFWKDEGLGQIALIRVTANAVYWDDTLFCYRTNKGVYIYEESGAYLSESEFARNCEIVWQAVLSDSYDPFKYS